MTEPGCQALLEAVLINKTVLPPEVHPLTLLDVSMNLLMGDRLAQRLAQWLTYSKHAMVWGRGRGGDALTKVSSEPHLLIKDRLIL